MTSTCFVRKDSVRRLSSSLLSLVMKEPPEGAGKCAFGDIRAIRALLSRESD
jgi:hypothetical protein